jgi:hypothetical protein
LRGLEPKRLWDIVLITAFVPSAAYWAFIVLIYPIGLGSHANIYTDAAAAWLGGADPWSVGPPTAVFAGPPPMLLPFLPFISLPVDVTRIAWFLLDLGVAVWVTRRLHMPAYWVAFPPLFSSIVLGHVEVLILAGLVLGGALSGLAAVIKPYAALPLLAERRWAALALAGVLVVITFPFLPWTRFFQEFQGISANLARQDTGDSVFGQPLLMVVAAISLVALGPRYALWLAVPVLWPHAQGIYKTMTVPVLTPVVALFWALPFPGSTLVGVVAFAVLVRLDGVRRLPPLLRAAIEPAAVWKESGASHPGSIPTTRLVAA